MINLFANNKSGRGKGAQENLGGSFRVAFITDVHIQPERNAVGEFRQCMDSIYSQDTVPNIVLNGGDVIMDAVAADENRVATQWLAWHSAMSSYTKIPMHYCLGNHDIWGWSKKSGCKGDEPLFGKSYFLQQTDLERSYYTFLCGGWRFIVLDSLLRLDSVRYAACLDREQHAWLESVLMDTPKTTPVLVMSHIPIMGGPSVFFAIADNTKPEAEGNIGRDWTVPSWQMHTDALALIELFARHGNVQLCLSGHTHINDYVSYRGIHFINGGAVCGQWWRGDFFGTPPGYLLLDLFPDGSFSGGYVPLTFRN